MAKIWDSQCWMESIYGINCFCAKPIFTFIELSKKNQNKTKQNQTKNEYLYLYYCICIDDVLHQIVEISMRCVSIVANGARELSDVGEHTKRFQKFKRTVHIYSDCACWILEWLTIWVKGLMLGSIDPYWNNLKWWVKKRWPSNHKSVMFLF